VVIPTAVQPDQAVVMEIASMQGVHVERTNIVRLDKRVVRVVAAPASSTISI
jgi:hypothetical protein